MMQTFGLFALARSMTANMARILMYHNFCGPADTNPDAVSTTSVRKQFEYLSRHFHVVSLASIVEQLSSNQPLGDRTVALTIDDGRRNCYEFLFPLLKEFGMPATFFVVSSFIRCEDWVWTDKVLWLSEQPFAPSELAPHRIEDFFRTLNQMRPELRHARIESVAREMNLSIPKQPPSKYAPCSWRELREMVDSGLVEIGSHTVTHPIFSSLTDEESWHELTASRAQIEEGIGTRVVSFCFPNGKPGDYRQNQVRQVKEAGYLTSLVSRPGMVHPGDDLYQLARLGVGGRSDFLAFSKELDGVEHYQEKLETSLHLRPQS